MARDAKPYIETNEFSREMTAQELDVANAPARQAVSEIEEINDAVTADQIEAAQFCGIVQGMNLVQKLITVSSLKTLAQIKESRKYKGSKVLIDGKVLTVNSWDEYCDACGLSRQIVDQNILNLSMLGEEFLEYSQRIGLGYRELRKLRKLPEEDRRVVIQQVEVDAGDKEAIVSLIEDIVAKHTKEKETLTKRASELQASLNSSGERNANLNKELGDLREEVAVLKGKRQKETPDEAAARLRADLAARAGDATMAVQLYVAKAIKDLVDHARSQGNATAHHTFIAGCLTEIVREVNILRANWGVRDEVLEDPTPPWMKPEVQEQIRAKFAGSAHVADIQDIDGAL
jgi:hypothetical protein